MTKPKTKAVAKTYDPTPAEKEKVEKLRARLQARPPSPDMKLRMDGKGILHITIKHTDPDFAQILMMADLGANDLAFYHGLSGHVATLGSHKRQIDEEASNFALSVIRGIEPRDQLEAMLAAQMAAVHAATMMFARRLNHVETIPQQDSAERALNKLARTFATQLEALKRYRTGGQQKVTVEHVTVNAGGQAIVGNIARGGEGADENGR